MAINTPGWDAPQANQRAPFMVAFCLDYSTVAGTYTLATVPAGYAVKNVATNVKTAFDSAPTLTIGDGDDVDGYLTSANIAPGTAGTVTTPAIKRSSGIANPYQFGKWYPSGDTIDGVWDPSAATAGCLQGWIELEPVYELGLPTSLTAVEQ